MAIVYLIHMDSKVGRCHHYIGYTAAESVQARFKRHKSGNGARLLNRANELSIDYRIVKTWDFPAWQDARGFEINLKRQKHASRFCPVCNQRLCNQENSGIEIVEEI